MPPATHSADREKEPFFDKWLTGATIDFDVLVEEMVATIELDAPRQRKRKWKRRDFQTYRELVGVILANLAYLIVAKKEPRRIAVPLGKPKREIGRYDRPGFRRLSATLQDLHIAKQIVLARSGKRGRVSTIEPTPQLVRYIQSAGVTFADFSRDPHEETIVLSRSEWDYPAGIKRREWIDYRETAETRSYRQEMAAINAHLEEASLSWMGMHDSPPDLGERRLHRAFNLPACVPRKPAVFRYGGRLYGGFWENMPSADRPFLWIQREPNAYLDFRSLFVRLAYAHIGLNPPDGDLYAVEGFQRHREGIKKFISAMLFARNRIARLPKGTSNLFPPQTKAASVRAAILGHHKPLAKVFETGVGFSLMFTESQILVRVLMNLNEAGITALPMHDGIMVPASRVFAALVSMIHVARAQTGFTMPVARK